MKVNVNIINVPSLMMMTSVDSFRGIASEGHTHRHTQRQTITGSSMLTFSTFQNFENKKHAILRCQREAYVTVCISVLCVCVLTIIKQRCLLPVKVVHLLCRDLTLSFELSLFFCVPPYEVHNNNNNNIVHL